MLVVFLSTWSAYLKRRSGNEQIQYTRLQNLDLKRKNEELSSFTFIANHDLKEPLRKIELYLTKMATSGVALQEGSKALIGKIIECVNRMKALLGDIFVYTMTNQTSEVEVTDLNSVVATSIRNLQEVIDEKQAIIEFDNLPLVKAVRHQMEQLFTNLISNSLKYSKKNENPKIKIRVDKEKAKDANTFWKISFTDNGIGFNEVYKGKIFEIFQRLHSKHEYFGTGMGLAICKKIVENHGGTIAASSNNNDGAVFTLPFL